MTPATRIDEALRLLASIALTHGFKTALGPDLVAPATLKQPGAAVFCVDVEETVRVTALSIGDADRRWRAALEIAKAIVDAVDPKGDDLRRAFFAEKEAAGIPVDFVHHFKDWVTRYVYLKDLREESAHYHLEAIERLEVKMVEAGLAREPAAEMIASLTRPNEAEELASRGAGTGGS
jgi:hypothetical protein